MIKIFVCSRLRGDIENNINRAKEFCKYVVSKGYIPFAPHIYFTQFLDDTIEKERNLGIVCGINWLEKCDEIWVFDKNISEGMRQEINFAIRNNIEVKYVRVE